MTINPLIKILTADDAPTYKKLRLQALKNNPMAFVSTFEVEQKKPLSSFIYEISASMEPPIWGYYGIFSNQELIGFCQISKSFAAKQAHIAYLYNLYINPVYRGNGLANKLLTEMLKKIKSQHIERVFITYLARNRCVRGFYDHLGFKQCGIKPKAIKQGDEYDDEVGMVLEL